MIRTSVIKELNLTIKKLEQRPYSEQRRLF